MGSSLLAKKSPIQIPSEKIITGSVLEQDALPKYSSASLGWSSDSVGAGSNPTCYSYLSNVLAQDALPQLNSASLERSADSMGAGSNPPATVMTVLSS